MRPWILQHFENVTGPDEQWRALCPACGKRRNLSIGAGRDRWLVRCFGTCSAKDVLDLVGLRFDDLLYETEARGENTSAVHSPYSSPLTRICIEFREPEVEHLLRRVEEGDLEPVAVVLPPLPVSATSSMRRVAEFYALVLGVRLAEGVEGDVLFASDWVAARIGLHQTTAWRALKRLVECGVLVRTGELPGRGKRRPGLYAPGKTNVVPLQRRAAS